MTSEYQINPGQNEATAKLLEAMLHGTIPQEIKPQLDPQSDMAFSFPAVKQLLNITEREILSLLESLANEGILQRKFSDKFLYCPQCGSGNISRGRILEHMACKYTGTEEEFMSEGRMICPRCRQELQSTGKDYRSLGLLYKCHNCSDVFNQPAIKWYCLKCSSVTAMDKLTEVNACSYSLNEAKRNRLKFELKPKFQLIQLLHGQGYEVRVNTTMKGRSGAEHPFDILATRDEGILMHHIAIGVEIATKQVELEKVFAFDDKAYDCGIHNKILIVIPALQKEAESFAEHQRIKVLEPEALDTALSRAHPQPTGKALQIPFKFESLSGLKNHLTELGYEVRSNARVKGKSEAEHEIDILATRDDVIVVHNIAIGIEVAEEPVGLSKVFGFDDKAYDSNIPDKVLIAVPGLTQEARRFARRQRIKVFEVQSLEPGE